MERAMGTDRGSVEHVGPSVDLLRGKSTGRGTPSQSADDAALRQGHGPRAWVRGIVRLKSAARHVLAIASGLVALVSTAPAAAYEVTGCDAVAEQDVRAVADFLEQNMNVLVDRYTFLSEQQRQEVVRKWVRLNIHCSDSQSECKLAAGYAHGGPGNRINLCYYGLITYGLKLTGGRYNRCDLARTIMHEQGHAHGFRSLPGHDASPPSDFVQTSDPMYRMGSMAENFCEFRANAGTFSNSPLLGSGNLAINATCGADLQCGSGRCSDDVCVCNENADCSTGQECFKPIGARNYCSSTSLPLNAACTRDDQCRSNQCEDDVCVCRHDSDCPAGQSCRTPITGRNSCEADTGIGRRPLNAACEADRDCLSNRCTDDRCVCTNDSDCPTGQECYAPVLAPNACRAVGLPLGAACQRDSQCRSEQCEGDRCVCRHDSDCPADQRCRTPITGQNRCE